VDGLVPPGGEYEFSLAQEAAFADAEAAMLRAAARYAALAAVSAAAAAAGGHHGAGGVWLAAAESLGAACVALFTFVASAGFSQIPATRGADLHWLLLALSDTAAAFWEVSVLSVGLALLHAASAAAAWPAGAFPALAALTAGATAARVALFKSPAALAAGLAAPKLVVGALTAPVRRLARAARWLVPGRSARAARLVAAKAGADRRPPILRPVDAPPPSPPPPEPEFTPGQDRVLRRLIRAAHVAAAARLLHGACEALFAVAAAATGDAATAVVAGVGALEVAASGALFFYSVSAFDSVISTSGSDVSHVLAGVGRGGGLASSFGALAHVVEVALAVKLAPLILSRLPAAAGWAAEGVAVAVAAARAVCALA
jgi:hypothetical protein